MKTWKIVSVPLLLLIMSVLVSGCSPGGSSGAEESQTPDTLPEIVGTTQEKIFLIADRVTQESNGLIVISYTETPLHTTSSGDSHYGVHYNMFTTKRADLMTPTDETRVMELVGRIFQLTTEHILTGDSSFTHSGVQVFDADVWFFGGHERGSVRIFIASRERLLTMGPSTPLSQWLDVATEYPEVIIFSSELQDLSDQPHAHEIEQSEDPQPTIDSSGTIVLKNQGRNMEGHTPRGFQGMGTGLFAGDNLNPQFPNNDGVQIFLTFDLSAVPQGTVVSAVLRSEYAHVQGSPFQDLGALTVEEIRYMSFSSALWDLETDGVSCIFATTPEGPFECDLTEAVQRSLDEGHPYVQFRIRFEQAGDGDGNPDLVLFFITNSNTNQPGTLELEVTVIP